MDDAAVRGVWNGRRVQSPLSIPAVARRQRPERRLRLADADGLRLGPPAGRRRGGTRGGGDRLDRGHGGAARRHSARPRHDVDDHQLDRHHPARALRGRGAPAGGGAVGTGGTVQNDILKEYLARGTYIYPPRPSLRIVTDIFAFCEREMPQWNTISISGYHIREAGSTAAQEIAFTFANAIAYVQAAHRRRAGRQPAGPAPVVLLQLPQRLPRGDREVPRGAAALGAHHAGPLRRHQPARAAAALPHADGRQHAHCPAARQQHRPRGDPGDGGGARRDPVTALQRHGTRRCRCPPKRRPGLRCARSR